MHLEVAAPRAVECSRSAAVGHKGPSPGCLVHPPTTREILDQQGHRIEKVEHREFDR